MGVTLFSLYMFNRQGEMLQYVEFHRPRQPRNVADDAKMTFGLLFSLNSFVTKLNPLGVGSAGSVAPLAPLSGPAATAAPKRSVFQSFRTNTYKLHYLETPSGVQLALTTDPGAPDMRDALRHVYGSLYVELVTKSPLHTPGRPFVSDPFVVAVKRYLAAAAG